ncbi:alanine/glycine:cation symporter family protein [Wolbachia endosymbiont of Ctenocephalides felis wCfeJ]|uniref:alanine/glycine:cation symporter family protein n=1 Tax=Wolbachia endosymbiont of Ctenocephalides felis wCfeJ TaxID=2732594 RepID=UPI0014486B97|nr:amino acid carrier protein [Wolbachia endosymbiont of Ctenocephalides felis wCfeJ]WCR57904.1 MAG: Amino-acid carrier protein AlsT [Wolbachia endosymbiont of Ctenocephalides felis wCfeJ]
MICRLLYVVLFCLLFNDAHAISGLYESYDAVLNTINNFMNEVLFFKVFYVPFVILLVAFGYIFLTLRFKFLNVRMFKHAFAILCGKYDTTHHDGHITHLQAFVTALSSTVGLGTVAGVAIAVSMGGPGAVPWMMVTGFFGMSAKFAEVTLAFRHRTEGQEQLFSGPFQYIRNGLEEFGFKKLGIVLAAVYAVFFVLSGLGGSVAFQTNQMVSILSGYSNWVDSNPWFLSSIISVLLALVIIGGIRRIAIVSSALVPVMSLIYIFGCVTIIAFNIHNFGNAFKILFSSMIDFNAVGGGVVGAFVAGIQRAIFASEAGVGSASITHAVAKDEEPVRTGLVAMIEPCFDTMLICCLTGITIVITGAYQTGIGEGILITHKAFETVSSWFPILLTVAAPLFAFSSVISFVYCCEMGWLYLFGTKSIVIYRIAVVVVAFFSGLSRDIMAIANIGGTLFSCLALINMTALILFSNQINNEVQCYLNRLRNNKIN